MSDTVGATSGRLSCFGPFTFRNQASKAGIEPVIPPVLSGKNVRGGGARRKGFTLVSWQGLALCAQLASLATRQPV